MKKSIIILTTILITSMFAVSQTTAKSVLGIWLSPKKDSKVEIFQSGTKFYGKIIWGTGTSSKDINNPDKSLRSREIVGLIILNGFVFDGDDTWEDGTIYDPREGKTYSCKMSLDGLDKLSMRGYVGISLFGRSETWTRVITK